jgi:uncharacterized membrane protein
MKSSKHTYLMGLLQTENEQLRKLHSIVGKALEEENTLSDKLSDEAVAGNRTVGERLSDKVASFGGSWKFIIIFMLMIFGWIAYNTILMYNKSFDPYPYILLNLILSCIAAIQAPLIMMSQNRKEEKDRQRAINDYMVNLKAEIEIRTLHEKIDLSVIDQYKHLCEIQQKQIELMETILKKVETNHKSA